MVRICFVAPELYPFSSGGVGVLIHNILTKYSGLDSEMHVLAVGELAIDQVAFENIFPGVTLWRVSNLSAASDDPARIPPEWAFTTHPWHYRSHCVARALLRMAAEGVVFDVVEFPDWGGLAFCASQEKLLGKFGETAIAVRLHSTDSILRAGQPVLGGESAATLSDLERKALRDADFVIAHLMPIAEATRAHFGFLDEWLTKVRVNAPPIPLKGAECSIIFGPETTICFPSKIQALKRPDVFLKGALAFIRSHPEYRGDILFMAHTTDEQLKEQLASKITADSAKRVSFLSEVPAAVRASISQRSISVFPSPFESFCLAAYEASLQGGWVALNGANPAFSDGSAWRDGANCLKFDGTSLGLAERLGRAWTERNDLRLSPIAHSPVEVPCWKQLPARDRTTGPSGVKEMKPLVSVVVPYYNMGRYIRPTLESALASTYTNLEIVIVDDCSSEPLSLIALDKIRGTERFDCVRVVSAPTNVGLSAARNLGIRAARGEFILTLDADDLIRSDFIETAVDALMRNPEYSLVVPQTAFVSDDPSPLEMKVIDYAMFVGEAVRAGSMANRFSTATSLGRRDIYLELPYDEFLDSYEDWDFYARAVSAGMRVVVTSEIFFYYRRRASSMIAANTRARHARNLSIIRAKQRFALGNAAIDLNVMTDAEASYHAQIDRLVGIGKAVNQGGKEAKEQYIRKLRAQIAHQGILLKETSVKLATVQDIVQSLRTGMVDGPLQEGDVSASTKGAGNRKPSMLMRLVHDLKLRRSVRALIKSGDFNPEWYLKNNPDVAAAGMDPGVHFVLHGRGEGRMPNAKVKR